MSVNEKFGGIYLIEVIAMVVIQLLPHIKSRRAN